METKPIIVTIETTGGLHTYYLYGEEAYSLVKDLAAKEVVFVTDRDTAQIDVYAARNIVRLSFPDYMAEDLKQLVP